MKAKLNKIRIHLAIVDIYDVSIDAFVYPTTPTLELSQRLRELGGRELIAETQRIGWHDIGEAVAVDINNSTSANKIVYTIPPKWGESHARGKLENTIWEVLEVAEDNQITSLAMPPIGAGRFGYPLENCAKVMFEQLIDFTFEPVKSLRQVMICLSNEDELNLFEHELSSQINALNNDDNTMRAG